VISDAVDSADPLVEGNVVMTGFMATGKSTVGRLLAERLGFDFVDTDAVIEARHGPIPRIFAEHGEAEFRRLERELAAELAGQRRLVIATGGGMLVDPVNADALCATGSVVCLTATVDTVIDRVLADGVDGRPLLAGSGLTGSDLTGRIGRLYAEREAAYRRFVQVSTDRRTPVDVCDAVLAAVVAGRSDASSEAGEARLGDRTDSVG
jgi:shikimate kinase